MNPPLMPVVVSDGSAELAQSAQAERARVEVRPNAKEFGLFATDVRRSHRVAYERTISRLISALEARVSLECKQSKEGKTLTLTITEAEAGEVTIIMSGFIFVVRLAGPVDSPNSIIDLVAVTPC